MLGVTQAANSVLEVIKMNALNVIDLNILQMESVFLVKSITARHVKGINVIHVLRDLSKALESVNNVPKTVKPVKNKKHVMNVKMDMP